MIALNALNILIVLNVCCLLALIWRTREALRAEKRAVVAERQVSELTVEVAHNVVSMEQIQPGLDRAADLLAREQRKSRELFDVIEGVLKERDMWKDMWFAHGREHLNAQTMLENSLTQARGMIRGAVVAINAYRKAAKLGPMEYGPDPGGPPVGTAEAFKKLLDKAEAEAPAELDARALRDEIQAREGQPKAVEAGGQV
jgi:hypothetical protein